MKKYGLIGFPLSHSFSQNYFANKFRSEGIVDVEYRNYPLEDIGGLERLLNETPDLLGLNVTIPYKEKVLPFLHESNDIVKAVGACNCIRIRDGMLFGFNTDVIGFEKSLQTQLKSHHDKALILGEGGAAKAVAHVLERLGIQYKYVVRRGVSIGKRILHEDLTDELIAYHFLIINSTPVGMYPKTDECPAINYDALSPKHFLYDLVYNPEKTLFLSRGEQRGAAIKNGYEMLILQAEESWRIWNEP